MAVIKGKVSFGSDEIFIGTQQPIDSKYKLWFNPNKSSEINIRYGTSWTPLTFSGNLSVSVDNTTITYNNLSQLTVKDRSITASKLATNIDASTIGFNSYSVNGYIVDDAVSSKNGQVLWTNKKITKEAIIKAIIFG
ncbi:MAG: hypothetical protein QW806_09300 [Nitrososphaerota archaeon]